MEHKKRKNSTQKMQQNSKVKVSKKTIKTKQTNKNSNKENIVKNTTNRSIIKPHTTKLLSQPHGEKAYKLLALQKNISTNKAKDLIDSGRVSVNGKRLLIARSIFPIKTHFEVLDTTSFVIFEDDKILALDKSAGIDSYSLLTLYPHYKLINRLDKDTSGVILLAKTSQMRKDSIEAFRQNKVEKEYFALIEGKLYEEITIEKKISTKKDSKAISRIERDGLSAISKVTPLQIFNQTTLVSVQILTGRTHQIRIHLASIKHPIVGDIIYNKSSSIKAKRLMLHCNKTALLGYTFQSSVDINDIFGISQQC